MNILIVKSPDKWTESLKQNAFLQGLKMLLKLYKAGNSLFTSTLNTKSETSLFIKS